MDKYPLPIDIAFISAFRHHLLAGDLFRPFGGEDHDVFQTSTIGALIEGIYDGEMTYAELAQRGDFGLGTFNALDGEMIAFGGQFWRIRSDGYAYPVQPNDQTPFAAVMHFDPTVKVLSEELLDWKTFQSSIENAIPSRNVFYALKVDATFDFINVRTVPRQEKPYPPLVEVSRQQPEYLHEGLKGTLIGFRFPAYTQGVNVAGYHVHFIDEGRQIGGHILDFRMRDATINIDVTSQFHMELPNCGDFLAADLDKDASAAIHEAEN